MALATVPGSGQAAGMDELYRELILDHWRHPHHRGVLPDANGGAEGTNPACGDEVTLAWRRDSDTLQSVAFEGQGCSICMASSSMLCDAVVGTSVSDAAATAHAFRDMLLSGGPSDELGDLEALQGVSAFPVRIKCAILPWNALLQGLGEEVEDD